MIHLSNGSLDAERNGVAPVTLGQCIGACIEPPMFKVVAKGPSVQIAYAVGEQRVPQCSSWQPRAIDPTGVFSSPVVFRAFEIGHALDVVFSERIFINHVAGKHEGDRDQERQGQGDHPQRFSFPCQNRESKPSSHHASYECEIEELAVHRIERDHQDPCEGTQSADD